MKLLRVAVVLALVAACGPDPRGNPGGGGDDTTVLPDAMAESCNKIDFVFVIDSSGSMAEEQSNLVTNAPLFAQEIENFVTQSGTPLDYRIAVTTAGRDVQYKVSAPGFGTIPFSEQGDNGNFRSGCGLTRRWIETGDADVSGKFACLANVGTTGPGAEMMLLGLEWSLGERVADGSNAGFLRDDALLAIVIITDQDDCSRTDNGFTIDGTAPSCFDPNDSNILPLSHYLSFLDTLKTQRGRWASAVIAGLGPSSCTSSFGNAAFAERMVDFANQAGTNSVTSSICDGNLASSLHQAIGKFDQACRAIPPIL